MLILDDRISDEIKDELNIYQHYHSFYTYDSEKYGKIDFCITYGDYTIYDYIEIICDKFEKNIFKKVILCVNIEEFNNDEVIKNLIKTIEKAIDMKEIMLSKMYDFTLKLCDEWEETDENENKITMDYIRTHLSKIIVDIWPETITFHADLIDEDGWILLGGHEICLDLSGEGWLNG